MTVTEAQSSNLKAQKLAVRKFQFCVLSFALWALSFRLCFASGEPDAFALTGIGARAGGMGNAFIGLSDQIETVYYNPAGLGNLAQTGATAMYETPTLSTSR